MHVARLSLALACVLGSAFAARWALSGINDQPEAIQAMRAAAERLDRLPKQIGTWKSEAESTLPAAAAETLQLAGYMARQYRDERTGSIVEVSLLVGPAGPLSVHTPEVCMQSGAFAQVGTTTESIVTPAVGAPGQFRSATFQARSLDGQKLRVFYGWSRGDTWLSPESPRVTLGGDTWLYKVQIGTVLTNDAERATGLISVEPASGSAASSPTATSSGDDGQAAEPAANAAASAAGSASSAGAEEPGLSFLREFLPAFQASIATDSQDTAPPPAESATN